MVYGKTGSEFVHFIAEAIQEKCAVFLGSVKVFSILSDRSKDQKIKSKKEILLIRTEMASQFT